MQLIVQATNIKFDQNTYDTFEDETCKLTDVISYNYCFNFIYSVKNKK